MLLEPQERRTVRQGNVGSSPHGQNSTDALPFDSRGQHLDVRPGDWGNGAGASACEIAALSLSETLAGAGLN